MNIDKKKRFKNLDENLDDDFESDFKNANFMNTKFVNLHVIFSFSIYFWIVLQINISRLKIIYLFRNFDLSDEEIESDINEKNEKN
jgi:hypothetical protein